MYRKRSYYKRSYAPRKKYSNETSSFSNIANSRGRNISVYVPLLVNSDHPMQGMRKIKNLKLSLNFSEIHSSVTSEYTKNPIYWALVYVPQGTQPQALKVTDAASSFYEPNQNVIMQGIQTSDNLHNGSNALTISISCSVKLLIVKHQRIACILFIIK